MTDQKLDARQRMLRALGQAIKHGRRGCIVSIVDPTAEEVVDDDGADKHLARLASEIKETNDPIVEMRYVFDVGRVDDKNVFCHIVAREFLRRYEALAEQSIDGEKGNDSENLSPWSDSVKYDLMMSGRYRKNSLILLYSSRRRSEDFRSDFNSSIQWMAEAFNADYVILLTTDHDVVSDEFVRLPPLSEEQYRNEVLAIVKRTLGAQDPKSTKSSFWRGVYQSLVERLTVQEGENIRAASSEADLTTMICKACYPSQARATHVVRELANRIGELKGEYPKQPDATRQVANLLLFIVIMKVAFDGVVRAAARQDAGYFRLFTLLNHFVGAYGDASTNSTYAISEQPWSGFKKDRRLRSFVEFCMQPRPGVDGPVVSMFTSTRAMRLAINNLGDGGGDGNDQIWVTLLEDVNKQLGDISGRVIEERRKLRERRVRPDRARSELTALLKAISLAHASNPELGNVEQALGDFLEIVQKHDALKRLVDESLESPGSPEGRTAALSECAYKALNMQRSANAESSAEPAEALEGAIRLLSILELSINLPERRHHELRAAIDACEMRLHDCRSAARGELSFEASVALARLKLLSAMLHDGDPNGQEPRRAADLHDTALLIESARRQQDGEEMRLAVDLVVAFRDECAKRYSDAEQKYAEIFRSSDAAGLREVAIRAAYGQMRCNQLSVSEERWKGVVHAQAFLRLQEARTPAYAAPRNGIMISYRNGTQTFVRVLYDELTKQLGSLSVWTDFTSIDEIESDFRAEMQLGLDRAQCVVLVFSPGYFRSSWCRYELTTALARKRLNAQKITWVCLDQSINSGVDPIRHVRKLADDASNTGADAKFFKDQLEEILKEPPLYDGVITIGFDGTTESHCECYAPSSLAELLGIQQAQQEQQPPPRANRARLEGICEEASKGITKLLGLHATNVRTAR